MATRLVICEKPSVAQSIAAVLGAKQRGDGFLHGSGWIVSWCFGHLVELAAADAYGEQYRRWSYDALPILPERWKYEPSKSKAKQLSILRGLMNRADVDSIVCGTDAGREGELIFRLVYDYCKCKKDGGRLPPVQRLWISSMEDSSIREGFANLKDGSAYDNLYRSALSRAQADWLVGINATRLFSCLYGSTLNVGRVQSPTLALIVERESAINSFTSEPFYTPEINCGEFTAFGKKLKDPKAAEVVRAAADGRDAVVLSVEKAKKTTAPPKLFDLTSLQRDANRLFGFTAQQTLDYAQSLYEKKLITYPRTDSRYLTEDMSAGLAELIDQTGKLLSFIKAPIPVKADAVINNAKVSDHHAIIPTPECAKADLSSLPAGELNILHMLIVRLAAAVAPTHSYEVVTAVLECNGHSFTAKGRAVLKDGWKAIDDAFRASLKNKPEEETDEDEGRLPELVKNQVFSSVKASVKEGKTTPPRRYTEDTLLSAMETAGAEYRAPAKSADFVGKGGATERADDGGLPPLEHSGVCDDVPEDAERKGLGTPATRAAIIEKLIKSGFVVRQKKNLIPTEKGINLIAVLPDAIKSPLLTAEWEQKLKAVEKGELAQTVFMDGIANMTKDLVKAHSAPIDAYKALFGAPANGRTNRSLLVGDCPRCGCGVTESKKGFFCSDRDCKFVLWKDNRFFSAKKKKITKSIAAALLKEGRVFFSDLYSERTGKTYAAAIVLEDLDGKVNFKLEFENGGKNK